MLMLSMNGAIIVPLVMTSFGELGPSAETYLQSVADVACSIGVVDRCFLVENCKALSELCFGSGARHCFPSLLQGHCEKWWLDVRDGAVVPFE